MTTRNKPIYLDYAATTPVDPKVAEAMMQNLTAEGNFGNPASRSHQFGWRAEKAVEQARQQIADLIGADPREIIFTSGATESDNLAIKGVAEFHNRKGKHIVTSKIEHKAILDSCRHLEQQGYEVTYLKPSTKGIVELETVAQALRADTILCSIMHVNNEIGCINDIGAIGKLCREKGILFHTDAAQSTGKTEIDVDSMHIDLLSISGHKIYGPKGIGALYVRRKPRVRLKAQMHGGGHERGMRSGTLATHQIVGLGCACSIAKKLMTSEQKRLGKMRTKLVSQLLAMDEVYLNGQDNQSVEGIINISFAYVEGESLLMALKDMAVSSGSACTSASLEPSYVLRALGLNDEIAHSSIRFSLGRFTTDSDIDFIISKTQTAVEKLRQISPLWDMHRDGIDISKVQWNTH